MNGVDGFLALCPILCSEPKCAISAGRDEVRSAKFRAQAVNAKRLIARTVCIDLWLIVQFPRLPAGSTGRIAGAARRRAN